MLNFILNFVFPKHCVGCGQSNSYLCSDCRASIKFFPTPLCPGCFKPIPRLGVHAACKTKTPLDGLAVVGLHSGVLQKLIKQIKYRGYFDMTPVAVKLMITSLPKDLAPQAITSVPLHSNRQRERGFNQSELLAKALAKQLGIPYQQLLVRHKATKPQANLNHSKRISNVAGAFGSLHSKLKGQVLIVDDVATTGATLNACALALKTADCHSVIALVLSHKN